MDVLLVYSPPERTLVLTMGVWKGMAPACMQNMSRCGVSPSSHPLKLFVAERLKTLMDVEVVVVLSSPRVVHHGGAAVLFRGQVGTAVESWRQRRWLGVMRCVLKLLSIGQTVFGLESGLRSMCRMMVGVLHFNLLLDMSWGRGASVVLDLSGLLDRFSIFGLGGLHFLVLLCPRISDGLDDVGREDDVTSSFPLLCCPM